MKTSDISIKTPQGSSTFKLHLPLLDHIYSKLNISFPYFVLGLFFLCNSLYIISQANWKNHSKLWYRIVKFGFLKLLRHSNLYLKLIIIKEIQLSNDKNWTIKIIQLCKFEGSILTFAWVWELNFYNLKFKYIVATTTILLQFTLILNFYFFIFLFLWIWYWHEKWINISIIL